MLPATVPFTSPNSIHIPISNISTLTDEEASRAHVVAIARGSNECTIRLNIEQSVLVLGLPSHVSGQSAIVSRRRPQPKVGGVNVGGLVVGLRVGLRVGSLEGI
jgi:hypothetical protein